jgi:hypothetical protein
MVVVEEYGQRIGTLLLVASTTRFYNGMEGRNTTAQQWDSSDTRLTRRHSMKLSTLATQPR